MAFYDEEIAKASTPCELRDAIENELVAWWDADQGGLYITSDTLGTAVSVALFIRGRHLDYDLPDVPSDIAGLLNWCINCEKIMSRAPEGDEDNAGILASPEPGLAIIDAMDDFAVKAMDLERQFIPLLNYRKDTNEKANTKQPWRALEVNIKFHNFFLSRQKLLDQLDASSKWFLATGSPDAGYNEIECINTFILDVTQCLFPVMELNDPLTPKKRVLKLLKHKDEWKNDVKESIKSITSTADLFRKFLKTNKWEEIAPLDKPDKQSDLPPKQELIETLIACGVAFQDTISRRGKLAVCSSTVFAFMKVNIALRNAKNWLWDVYGPEGSEKITYDLMETTGFMSFYDTERLLQAIKQNKSLCAELNENKNLIEKASGLLENIPKPEELLEKLHRITKQLQAGKKGDSEEGNRQTAALIEGNMAKSTSLGLELVIALDNYAEKVIMVKDGFKPLFNLKINIDDPKFFDTVIGFKGGPDGIESFFLSDLCLRETFEKTRKWLYQYVGPSIQKELTENVEEAVENINEVISCLLDIGEYPYPEDKRKDKFEHRKDYKKTIHRNLQIIHDNTQILKNILASQEQKAKSDRRNGLSRELSLTYKSALRHYRALSRWLARLTALTYNTKGRVNSFETWLLESTPQQAREAKRDNKFVDFKLVRLDWEPSNSPRKDAKFLNGVLSTTEHTLMKAKKEGKNNVIINVPGIVPFEEHIKAGMQVNPFNKLPVGGIALGLYRNKILWYDTFSRDVFWSLKITEASRLNKIVSELLPWAAKVELPGPLEESEENSRKTLASAPVFMRVHPMTAQFEGLEICTIDWKELPGFCENINRAIQILARCVLLEGDAKESVSSAQDDNSSVQVQTMYLELNLSERKVVVGETIISITSDKIWNLLTELARNRRQHQFLNYSDGGHNWKYARDMFRKKLQKHFGKEAGKQLLKRMIPASKGCYILDASVKVKGSGQMKIRRTKSNQHKPGIN